MERLGVVKVSFALFFLLSILSCKKEEQYMNNAEIIGYNMTMGPCSGGYKIVIDNIANPIGFENFIIETLPANFIIDNSTNFPLLVKINWENSMKSCPKNAISVSKIARR